jgi:TatD DNase family protein
MAEGKHLPGVLHCFTGTVQEAEEVIKRGWHLSLSGIVTFKKSDTLREVAKIVPLEQLLIETDTPYLAPQSHRGKRNEPAYLIETAAFIAETCGISIDRLASATKQNAETLFSV